MGMISRLEHIWEQDKNYGMRYTIVFSGSIFTHIVLGFMFAISGRPLFAAMNAGSILVYLLWIYAFSRVSMNNLMLLVPFIDVAVHACVYNRMLGPSPAFYLYVITIVPVSFFLSIRDSKTKHPSLISSVLTVLGVMLMLATLSKAPIAPFSDKAANVQFFQINLILCSMLLGLHSWEFLSEARTTQDVLSRHAEYDQLTGLRNRYSLNKETGKIHGTQYCVVMCDIDDFKQVNDTYGHATGDLLLSQIGRILQSCTHREDIICRWGGEEFLLVIKTDIETTQKTISRIRQKLSSVTIEDVEKTPAVTMTFGIADCLEADSFDRVTAIADRNLLRGKRTGKNCVVSSEDEFDVQIHPGTQETLDTSSLTGAIFAAFAATSDTTYIYICNLTTNVSRWSKTAVDYFGLPSEYMYDAGKIWLGFVHPDDRAAYSADIEAVLSGKKNTHDVTYRARNKNGEYVVCACKGVVTEGDGKNAPMFAGTMTNLGPADSNFGIGR